MDSLKIVLIGAGNVATHLGYEFKRSGNSIVQVYSRTVESAKVLADSLSCVYTNIIDEITSDADLYVVSINDEAISLFLGKFDQKDKLIAHTSGSISLDVFESFPNAGVFYPLQTFSKNRNLNFKEIPVFIESKNEESELKLSNLANSISDNVKKCNSEQRKYIHLSAIFVCNFTNHLISIAENIIEGKEIDKDIFKPLIEETIEKALAQSASKSQTGPAYRNDIEILNSHLELLSFNPQFQSVYKELSSSILKSKNSDGS